MPVFSPPTRPDRSRSLNRGTPADRLMRYYSPQETGTCVWKDALGVWHEDLYPYAGNSISTDHNHDVTVVSGPDSGILNAQEVFLGGHEYEITTAKADELLAAGFEDGLGEYPLEKYGASINQTLAATYTDLWKAYISDAGSSSPSDPSRRILGGDCVEVTQVGASTFIWHWLDTWASGTGSVAGGLYTTDFLLPLRNAVAAEGPPGTLGGQIFESPSSHWLDPGQEGLGVGKVWWPLGGVRPGLTGDTYVVAYLLEGGFSQQVNFGVLSTSLITLNLFALHQSHIDINWGPRYNFWLTRLVHDAPYVYGYGDKLTGAFGPPVQDVIGWHNLRGQEVKIGRVPDTQVTNLSAWEFWNGEAWESDITRAAPMERADYGSFLGATGTPRKVATGHWITVGRTQVYDPFLDVYKATAPQGPWTKIARVPIPSIGVERLPGYVQVSHHASLAMHAAAPANHSLAFCSRTLLGYANGFHFTGLPIDSYSPQFVVVPHNPEA